MNYGDLAERHNVSLQTLENIRDVAEIMEVSLGRYLQLIISQWAEENELFDLIPLSVSGLETSLIEISFELNDSVRNTLDTLHRAYCWRYLTRR